MTGETVDTLNKSWREIGINWLVNQGAVTVLLFCICVGGGYMAYVMIPTHLNAIQSGYEKIQERNGQAIEKLAASHEKAVDRIITVLERREANK